MIDVDAQDLRSERARILADSIQIAVTRAVATADKEPAVAGKRERGAVVTVTGPLNHDDA